MVWAAASASVQGVTPKLPPSSNRRGAAAAAAAADAAPEDQGANDDEDEDEEVSLKGREVVELQTESGGLVHVFVWCG
jgi:hypothetical protein